MGSGRNSHTIVSDPRPQQRDDRSATPRAVEFVAERARCYSGVAGVWYREGQGGVEILIVAPPPMTGSLRILSQTWLEAYGREGEVPKVSVAAALPDGPTDFRCAYRRPADDRKARPERGWLPGRLSELRRAPHLRRS